MALHFSKEEFSQRKLKVLQSMKDQNLDALINLIKVELDHDKTLPSCNNKRFDE